MLFKLRWIVVDRGAHGPTGVRAELWSGQEQGMVGPPGCRVAQQQPGMGQQRHHSHHLKEECNVSLPYHLIFLSDFSFS